MLKQKTTAHLTLLKLEHTNQTQLKSNVQTANLS